MSWLNNSLNTIKGQLTTLAQEVLAETAGPGDDEYRGVAVETRTAAELLADKETEYNEISKLCSNQDSEIAFLRKQIAELQNKITDSGGSNAATSGARNSKSTTENVVLEDSWCWEPDSSKNDNDRYSESSSGNGTEMVNIRLEEVSLGGAASKATKREQPSTTDLQMRVQQLEQENKQLNLSLEELDSQHNLAIQNVIEVKMSLQDNLTAITNNYETLKKEHADKFITGELELGKLQKEFEKLAKEHQSSEKQKQTMRQQIDHYAEQMRVNFDEMADLQSLLEKKTQDNVELIERVKVAGKHADKTEEERVELLQKMEQLMKEVEEMKKLKEKKTSESSTSSTGKQSEDEFILIRDGDTNSSSPTTPPSKEELKDKIVQLENSVSELMLENGSLVLKVQDRETEMELAVNVLKQSLEVLQNNCEDLEKKLRIAEEQIEEHQENIIGLKEKAADYVITQEQLKVLTVEKLKDATGIAKMKETLNNMLELEKRLLLSEQEKEKLQLELRAAENQATEWESKVQNLNLENQQLKLNAGAETDTLNNSAELELKVKSLTEENETLRTELEDSAQPKFLQGTVEEKREITDLDADGDEDKPFNLQKFRDLLNAYIGDVSNNDREDSMQKAYRALRERLWKVDKLEKSLVQISEELIDLQDCKLVWDHEKKTLEADISQYIMQCDELMKNNEILLNELENYKRNKLETIPENNEENILQLETQLEECTKLNRTLEEEYAELHENIEEMQREKQDLNKKLLAVEQTNVTLMAKEKDLNSQLQTMELEKSNLLFEINELKSAEDKDADGSQALMQAEEKCKNLESQLTRLSNDHADLVATLQSQKSALMEANRRRDEAETALKEQELAAFHIQEEMKEFQNIKDANEILVKEHEALRQLHEAQTAELRLLQESSPKAIDTNSIARIAQLETELLATADIQKSIETLNFEKNEMIKALQQKHAENMQYYMEIQRLQPIVQQLQQQVTAAELKACDKCATLEATVNEFKKVQEKLQDQINFLKEKSDILTTNLLTEQTNQKLVQQEKVDVEEQNASICRDLQRLREHLLEIEDIHTQETVQMQRDLDQAKAAMDSLQQEVSQSSNAYTSASIRANQQAETLQAQHVLVVQQRDELVQKLSFAEDRELKNQAALCNLQCALEQFQNDKENDIKTGTQRIRKELQQELERQAQLQNEIGTLQQQLADANQGLRAASRLSDQLEACQQTIAALREEVDNMKEQNSSLEEKLNTSETNQTDKIDKNLIKSLLIGYVVSANPNDKQQVLRMISSVLDFTQSECDKIGLNKQQSSWLGALLGSGTPPDPMISQGSGTHSKATLIQAFVQFLDQESQPQADPQNMPNLLNITQAIAINASNAPGSRRTSVASNSAAPMPLLFNSTVLDEFAPTRNSSSILKDILSDS